MSRVPTSIFWVDDDLLTTARFLVEAMTIRGFTVNGAKSIRECLQKLGQYSNVGPPPDAVVLDIILSVSPADIEAALAFGFAVGSELDNARRAGAFLLRVIKKSLPDVPVIVLTNLSEGSDVGANLLTELRQDKAVRAVRSKPVRADELEALVREAITQRGHG